MISRAIKIPELPAQIDLKDLDWHQDPPRLLKEKHFLQLMKMRSNGQLPENERVSKKILQKIPGLETIEYSVAFVRHKDGTEHCIAYYKGEKHNKHLAKGFDRKLKWFQDHQTGKFKLVKIYNSEIYDREAKNIPANYEHPKEAAIMTRLGIFAEMYGHQSKRYRKMVPHLMMDWAPGMTMEQWFQSKKFDQLPDAVYLDMVISILKATFEMHSKSVAHHDLNASNIIYDISGNLATIIDFGLSRQLDENKSQSGSSPFIKDMIMMVDYIQEGLRLLVTGSTFWCTNQFKELAKTNETAQAESRLLILEIAQDVHNNRYITELRRIDASEKNIEDFINSAKRVVDDIKNVDISRDRSMDSADKIFDSILELILSDRYGKDGDQFKEALFNLIHLSVIKDDKVKIHLQYIFRLIKSKSDIPTLIQALESLGTLRNSLAEITPVERHIKIDDWHKLSAVEKQELIQDFSPVDRVLLVYEGQWPANQDESIALQKLGVEVKRWLSDSGIHFASNEITPSAPELSETKTENPKRTP